MTNKSIKKILKLEAAYKDYIWGGFKLKNEWGKNSPFERTAESWEFSTHPDGESIIAEGEHAGKKLSQVLTVEMLGTKFAKNHSKTLQENIDAPILIKLIDAKDNLSVQVHPNDDYALKNENSLGKTEMWYIIDAEEGAGIYCGFNKNTDKREVAARIADETLTEILNYIPCKSGDSFFIPAGTVHAIGKGLTICEVQQNSNITYRLYDYGRVGADGKKRPLHIDKALDVANFNKYTKPLEIRVIGTEIKPLVKDKYFTVSEYSSNYGKIYVSDESFAVLNIIHGEGVIFNENDGNTANDVVSFKKGDTLFLPAGIGEVTYTANLVWGKLKFLLTGLSQ